MKSLGFHTRFFVWRRSILLLSLIILLTPFSSIYGWELLNGLTDVMYFSIIRNMSNYNNENLNKFSEIFKALSNVHRLNVFLYLAEHCTPGESSTDKEMRMTVGELGEGLNIAPSTVSHHLRELRRAGLIRMERKGKNIECWAEQKTVDQMVMFFQNSKGGE
ncbi:hypothetical protein HLI_12640 [Halobacillus litoralis]|uniref:HTH arsR-type domain-containing protein n=2 Tax=Halobacillus litoralis TaxID=45668 RepID=A0A410ME56_9BACI|nr:hypothetical protein HLI_12640 [Halobacillus litoralis]